MSGWEAPRKEAIAAIEAGLAALAQFEQAVKGEGFELRPSQADRAASLLGLLEEQGFELVRKAGHESA